VTPAEQPAAPPKNWVAAAHASDGDPVELAHRYAAGAATYDATAADDGYRASTTLARLVAHACDTAGMPSRGGRVLDAGCGTGLVGAELTRLGFPPVDGADLTPEMATLAAGSGAYRAVHAPLDLHDPWPDTLPGNYDVVTCAGVFTYGHVLPRAFRTLVQAARIGGLIAISASLSWARLTGFEVYVRELRRTGLIDSVRPTITEYVSSRPGEDGKALYLLAQVRGTPPRPARHVRAGTAAATGRARGHRS
jgi:predicted TPR repeat methyltransferase